VGGGGEGGVTVEVGVEKEGVTEEVKLEEEDDGVRGERWLRGARGNGGEESRRESGPT